MVFVTFCRSASHRTKAELKASDEKGKCSCPWWRFNPGQRVSHRQDSSLIGEVSRLSFPFVYVLWNTAETDEEETPYCIDSVDEKIAPIE